MMFQKEILDVLDEAEKNILSHPKGELILAIKEKIWGAIEGGEGTSSVVQTNGLKRRARLDILCVKKVINVWDNVLPNDKRIIELLKMIDEYFNGKIDKKSLERVKDSFSTVCDDLGSHSNYEISLAAYVGFATVRAVSTAIFDKAYYGDDLEAKANEILDDDIGPDEWDTSYYASMAYVGKPTWEEQDEVSINKRRGFWMWYITKAVPEAYEAFFDDEE